MNKACIQISFPAIVDVDEEIDHSVGVSAYARIELISRLAPNGIDTLEYWKVKFCFCIFRTSESSEIYVYLQNDINGSLGKILRTMDDIPSWLSEENIVKPGDTRTDVLVLDGNGPWNLSYPTAVHQSIASSEGGMGSVTPSYGSDFDAIGSLYKLKTVIDPSIWQSFGPSESHTKNTTNYIEQTSATEISRILERKSIEERYDVTLHGVVNVEYTVGGELIYYIGERNYLIGGNTTSEEQAFFKKSIINANWQYVVMSIDERRVISSGNLSISEVFGPIPEWIEP